MVSLYTGQGINDVYSDIVADIMARGSARNPRGRRSRELTPAIFSLNEPRKRLVTAVGRPVNVTFALAEVLWILAGRNDVEMLAGYNSTIHQFSDNGETFNAAYGRRMRRVDESTLPPDGFDQLHDLIRALQIDPESRQAVMVYRDPWKDRTADSHGNRHETKDRACNVLSQAMIVDGKLNWTQYVRSNDALWGVPYNVMQWTHIMEYVANRLGIQVGVYHHIANSLHVYDWHYEQSEAIEPFDLYAEMHCDHVSMGVLTLEHLNTLLREEQAIRTAKDPAAVKIHWKPDTPSYWVDVLRFFWAHRFYKNHEDVLAANVLMATQDPVYQAAQARFYYYWRWHKPEHKALVERILERAVWPDSVKSWVTMGHAPTSE